MTKQKSARQHARERGALDGADAQALEGALSMTERERDEAREELARSEQTMDAQDAILTANYNEQLARANQAERERDEALAKYQFMVDRACDEKLDGYRELASRLEAMEADRDKWRRMARVSGADGEHLDGPALAMDEMDDREEAIVHAAIRLVEAWQDADDADQAHYRAQALTDIRERFGIQNRVTNAKGEMTAASVRLLDAVMSLQQAGRT